MAASVFMNQKENEREFEERISRSLTPVKLRSKKFHMLQIYILNGLKWTAVLIKYYIFRKLDFLLAARE